MERESVKVIYEYCLLRFVPDIERGEFINIGLMMMSKRAKWLRVEISIDERRIRSFCPKCDLERLKKQIEVFKDKDVPSRDLPVEERYRWLAAVKSAIIQTSPSHPGILKAEAAGIMSSLENKFTSLFSRLIK